MYVEYKNIIDPLMEGTAVRADIADLAANAKEIILGRSNLTEVLKRDGVLTGRLSSAEEDELLKELKSSIGTYNIGKNLIKIEYEDEDPERAFAITKTIADVLVQGLRDTKLLESKAAYEFIDSQVREYERVLSSIQGDIDLVRQRNVDAQPEFIDLSEKRLAQLSGQIDDLEQRMSEAQIVRDSLREQLAGEVESYAALATRESSRARLAELQSNLNRLSLDYKDTHPDIVRLNGQIANLESLIDDLQSKAGISENLAIYFKDDDSTGQGLYQTLKQKYYEAQTQIRTLQKQLTESERKFADEQQRLQRIRESEVEFHDLMRDYDVKEEILQDLLVRRERARVSANIDAEQATLSSIRITEPAYRPFRPKGPPFLAFAIGGIIAGVVVPVLMLFTKLLLDPRIRMPRTLNWEPELPLLGVVGHLATPRERRRRVIWGTTWSIVFVALTVGLVVVLQVHPAWQTSVLGLRGLPLLETISIFGR
jgi:polysaccharide chain length determinant protein (PEP-CTERM system associated)